MFVSACESAERNQSIYRIRLEKYIRISIEMFQKKSGGKNLTGLSDIHFNSEVVLLLKSCRKKGETHAFQEHKKSLKVRFQSTYIHSTCFHAHTIFECNTLLYQILKNKVRLTQHIKLFKNCFYQMNNQLPDGFFCFQKHFEAPFYYFLEKRRGG